jgi:hypothetical protein
MLSQPFMQATYRAAVGLSGLVLLSLLAAGCGQNEGGRCQIDSDCASGLTCEQGSTGNGKCRNPNNVVRDAAPELTSNAGPEVSETAEVQPDTASGPDTAPEADVAAGPDTGTESEAGGAIDSMTSG